MEQILTKYLIFFYKTSKSKRIKPNKLEKAIDELEKFYNKFKRKSPTILNQTVGLSLN